MVAQGGRRPSAAHGAQAEQAVLNASSWLQGARALQVESSAAHEALLKVLSADTIFVRPATEPSNCNLCHARPQSRAAAQVEPAAHEALMKALWADTAFLAGQGVMDYSLLVGVDSPNGALVVGIIDFLRQVRCLQTELCLLGC